MTGFGRSTRDLESARVVCEARSVNSRGLQTSLRTAERFSGLEELIRDRVRSLFSRGRIEVSLLLEDLRGGGPSTEVDLQRARGVTEAARALSDELGIPLGLTAAELVRIPGILVPAGTDPEPGEVSEVMECVESCLEELRRSRLEEGEAIRAVFRESLERVRGLAARVMEGSRSRVQERFLRLRERVSQLVEGLPMDDSRLAQELAFLADRLDISEEHQRLLAHMDNCRLLLDSSDGDSGRRLSFLLQELQREANTLCSKLDEPSAVLLGVEIKNELASLREQVANVD